MEKLTFTDLQAAAFSPRFDHPGRRGGAGTAPKKSLTLKQLAEQGPGWTIRLKDSRRNKRRLGKAFRQAQRIERITAARKAREAAAAA